QEASMYQILIIFVALVCSAVMSEAQSLSGTVLDPQGAAVPKAEIKLYVRQDGGELKTTSDQKGRYRFERLARGEYVIEVKAEGFGRSPAQSVQLERGHNMVLDIPLKLAVVSQQVTVTASGSAQGAEEISKATSTVSWQEIQARDEFSIAEALR